MSLILTLHAKGLPVVGGNVGGDGVQFNSAVTDAINGARVHGYSHAFSAIFQGNPTPDADRAKTCIEAIALYPGDLTVELVPVNDSLIRLNITHTPRTADQGVEPATNRPPRSLTETVGEAEKSAIIAAQTRHKWNTEQAAQELEVSPTMLWRKMHRLGISKPQP